MSNARASAPSSRSGTAKRDEDERVSERDPVEVVPPELTEVLEPDEARRPDEVVLGEREPECDQRRESHQHRDPEQERRQHERVLAALTIANHVHVRLSPVAASKR